MKTALVFIDGLRQITLTPETDEEKHILETLHSKDWQLSIERGQFFICRDDYARFGTWPSQSGQLGRMDSTMLVLRPDSSGSEG